MFRRLDSRLKILDEAIGCLQGSWGHLGWICDDEIIDIVVVNDVGYVVSRLLGPCLIFEMIFFGPWLIFGRFIDQVIAVGQAATLLLGSIARLACGCLLLRLRRTDVRVLLEIAHFQRLDNGLFWFLNL